MKITKTTLLLIAFSLFFIPELACGQNTNESFVCINPIFNAGSIPEGHNYIAKYKCVNKTHSPVLIKSVKTGDGGFYQENWSKTPIPPGDTTLISFTFNSIRKRGPQNKTGIITYSNRDGEIIHIRVQFKATVIPDESASRK